MALTTEPRAGRARFGGELPLIMTFFIVFPTALGVRAQVVVLLALPLLALAVHKSVDRSHREQRRLLSPLVLFTLAFVVALGPRAVLLASGDPGRFFVINGASGETVSAFVTPPQARHSKDFNAVRNPFVEATTRDWGPPASNARRGFRGRLIRAPSDGYEGLASAEVRVRTGTGGSYVAVPVGENLEAKASVRPGRLVAGSLAAKSLERLPRGPMELNVIYYDAKQRYIVDRPLSGRGSHAIVADPHPGRWYRLYGTDRVPRRAAFANLLFVVHGLKQRAVQAFRLDAALLMPNVSSRARYYTYGSGREKPGIWSHVAGRALAVSIAMLLAVFVGYLFPLGARLAGRMPQLQIPGMGDRRTRRVIVVFVGVGIAAYCLEMATYGGYWGYLASFSANPPGGNGKFYIRMLATLTTGSAVLLLTRRIWFGRSGPWPRVEVGIIVLGFGVAFSYWLKAVIAIPALTVLLFWYFTRRRAVIWLGVFAAVFALMTPFVYQVRSQAGIRLSDFTSSSYWSEFFTNLQSRFFHFESLMVVIPYAHRERPWQPLLDFFGDAIPRVLWHNKPLSVNARFTEQYLQGALHNRTDVGVISLPGELWLTGGWLSVVLVGIAIGVLLRLTQTIIASPARQPGTLLLAVTLLTTLVFANDGWGLASTAISVLVLAVGWLVPLRRVRRQADTRTVPVIRDRRRPQWVGRPRVER
jgi:hypothetical protein